MATRSFFSFPRRIFSFVACGVVTACSSTPANTGDTGTNGVDDVRAACQIRAQWTRATSAPCSNCLGLSRAPRCACADEAYAGACSAQASAETAEPTCSGVSSCTGACSPSDCACIDACYANVEKCRVATAAVDGCVAQECDSYCR